MIPAIIFAFLVGATLSLGFRVFILIPVTLLAFASTLIIDLSMGASLPAALKFSCLVGVAPQLGYAVGLLTRNVFITLKAPRKRTPEIVAERSSVRRA